MRRRRRSWYTHKSKPVAVYHQFTGVWFLVPYSQASEDLPLQGPCSRPPGHKQIFSTSTVHKFCKRVCLETACLLPQASGNLAPGAPDDLGLRLRALQEAPQPLVDLFNQYAAPYQQWELCIELVHASDGVDMAYVQQLWDLYLKQVTLLVHPCYLSLCPCVVQQLMCSSTA